jgi:hypothetical protein
MSGSSHLASEDLVVSVTSTLCHYPCLGAHVINVDVAECNEVKHEKCSLGSREA